MPRDIAGHSLKALVFLLAAMDSAKGFAIFHPLRQRMEKSPFLTRV
ncbi:hypothetical protein [Azospirillum doebereinerae]